MPTLALPFGRYRLRWAEKAVTVNRRSPMCVMGGPTPPSRRRASLCRRDLRSKRGRAPKRHRPNRPPVSPCRFYPLVIGLVIPKVIPGCVRGRGRGRPNTRGHVAVQKAPHSQSHIDNGRRLVWPEYTRIERSVVCVCRYCTVTAILSVADLRCNARALARLDLVYGRGAWQPGLGIPDGACRRIVYGLS